MAALTAQVKALQNVISSAGEKRGNTEMSLRAVQQPPVVIVPQKEAGLQSFEEEDASRETGTMVAEEY